MNPAIFIVENRLGSLKAVSYHMNFKNVIKKIIKKDW